MLFLETKFEDAYPIQAYGSNYFRVNDQILKGGIFVCLNILKLWKGYQDLSFLDKSISSMDILFIGSGKDHKPINENLKNILEKYRIGFEIFSTPVACRAYNITIANDRKAGALLSPIIKNLNS